VTQDVGPLWSLFVLNPYILEWDMARLVLENKYKGHVFQCDCTMGCTTLRYEIAHHPFWLSLLDTKGRFTSRGRANSLCKRLEILLCDWSNG
jgi:hypothetical protein